MKNRKALIAIWQQPQAKWLLWKICMANNLWFLYPVIENEPINQGGEL
jgi:hypothetical protein